MIENKLLYPSISLYPRSWTLQKSTSDVSRGPGFKLCSA